jgi:S1-C subfamily serine protease
LIARTTIIVTAALALMVGALGLSGSVNAAEQTPITVSAQQTGSAWLGVGVQDSPDGVLVMEVANGSPADEAGVRVGDVITMIDDTEIDSVDTLLSVLADYAPGDEITLTTTYHDVESEHAVTLTERPADLETQPTTPNQPDQGFQFGALDFLGLNLTAQADGLHVNSIAADSPLADSGLQEGDVITSIGGLSVSEISSPRDVIQMLMQGGTLEVVVERDGAEQTLEIALPGLGDIEVPDMNFDFDFDIHGMMGDMGQYLHGMLGVEMTRTDEGLELTMLDADSPLVDLGFAEGDVITAVNGTALSDLNLEAAHSIFSAVRDSETVTVTVLRDGEEQTIDIDLSNLDLPDFPGLHFGMMGGMGAAMQNRLGVEVTWTDAGLELTTLDADSPLVDLGFAEGDVITAVNGTALTDMDLSAVESIVSELTDTETLSVTVERDGAEQTIDINLSDIDFSLGDMMPFMGHGMMGQGYGYGYGMMQPPTQLGVQYRVLTADVAAEEGLDLEEGALIEQVYADTPAANAGLQEGDVVTAVDGEDVDAEHTLSDRLSAYEEGDTVTLTVVRDGESQSIDVTLGARSNGMRFEFRSDFGRQNGGPSFQMPGRGNQNQGPNMGSRQNQPNTPSNSDSNEEPAQPANSTASSGQSA